MKVRLVYMNLQQEAPPIAEAFCEGDLTESQLAIHSCYRLNQFQEDDKPSSLGMLRLRFWVKGERAGRAVTDSKRQLGWTIPKEELERIAAEVRA